MCIFQGSLSSFSNIGTRSKVMEKRRLHGVEAGLVLYQHVSLAIFIYHYLKAHYHDIKNIGTVKSTTEPIQPDVHSYKLFIMALYRTVRYLSKVII